MDWKNDSIKQFIQYKLQNPVQSQQAAKSYILEKKKSANIDKLYKELLKQRSALLYLKNQNYRLSQIVIKQVAFNQQNCQKITQKCSQIKQNIKMRNQIKQQTQKQMQAKEDQLKQEISEISKAIYEQKLNHDISCKKLENQLVDLNQKNNEYQKIIEEKTLLVQKLKSQSKIYSLKKQRNSRLTQDIQIQRKQQEDLRQTLTSQLQKFKTAKTKAEAFSKHLQASSVTKLKLFYEEILQFIEQKDIFKQLNENDFKQTAEDGTELLFLPDSYPKVFKIDKNIGRVRRLLKQKADMLQTMSNLDQIPKEDYQNWLKNNESFIVLTKPYELKIIKTFNQRKEDENVSFNQKEVESKQFQILRANSQLLKKLIQKKEQQFQGLKSVQAEKKRQDLDADQTIQEMNNKLDRMDCQITKRTRNTTI